MHTSEPTDPSQIVPKQVWYKTPFVPSMTWVYAAFFMAVGALGFAIPAFAMALVILMKVY